MPALRPHHHTAVALEFHGADEADVEAQALAAMEAAVALGGNDEDTWYATDARGLALQKTFRHAVPEAVNQRIDELRRRDPAITKLGTDMSVPDAALEETIAMYRRDLARAELQAVAFGHVGNNHVHVNILPQSREAYARGRALYQDWAARVVALGGSVSAEHGIGVLKTGLLRVMYGEEGISQMRALKRTLDPAYRLNPGKLFDIVA
jgi:D-lactate dehydrogenase (cytochrome)